MPRRPSIWMITIGINSIVCIDLSITINTFSVCSSFRGLIKDVHVTLTPLTDFEKEIEKSSKRVSLQFIVCLLGGAL